MILSVTTLAQSFCPAEFVEDVKSFELIALQDPTCLLSESKRIAKYLSTSVITLGGLVSSEVPLSGSICWNQAPLSFVEFDTKYSLRRPYLVWDFCVSPCRVELYYEAITYQYHLVKAECHYTHSGQCATGRSRIDSYQTTRTQLLGRPVQTRSAQDWQYV